MPKDYITPFRLSGKPADRDRDNFESVDLADLRSRADAGKADAQLAPRPCLLQNEDTKAEGLDRIRESAESGNTAGLPARHQC